MIHEKLCGAIIYDIHMDCAFVLVEYMAKGHVSIPKGRMKDGETEEEAAVRVVREETNLEIRIMGTFRRVESYITKSGVQKTVVIFLAQTDNMAAARPLSEKVSEVRWMSMEYALREITYDSDKEVLCDAGAFLGWRYYHVKYNIREETETPKLLYREHAVDIHSHIIPGVDDGAKTMDEAQEMALLDREEGIDVVFATPHYGIENGFAPKPVTVQRRFNKLQQSVYWDQGDCPYPLLILGTEWYCSDDIVDRIKQNEAFALGKNNWYMVEFLEWGSQTEPADIIIYRLAKMRMARIRTILAHPERYRAIQQDWTLAKRICDLGVKLQVNAYDLYLNENLSTRNLAQWLAQERLISFIGSDMHGTREGARRPRMKEGINWLYDNVDEEYADAVVRRNAELYLGVQKLPRI